jgi:hypothetical protein
MVVKLPARHYASGGLASFSVEPTVKVAGECGIWKSQEEKRIETKELPNVTAKQDRNRLVFDFDYYGSSPKLDRFETSLVVKSIELEGHKDLSRILLMVGVTGFEPTTSCSPNICALSRQNNASKILLISNALPHCNYQ